jgi:putative hydrolase
MIGVRQDMHVHSTFSDGRDTIEDNVAEAERLGLLELTCVDHVRVGTDWVADYAAAVRQVRTTTPVLLHCAVEAKLLDTAGNLDLPPDLDGVDAIYAADHQVPLADGPHTPSEIKEMMAGRTLSAADVVEAIVSSTAGALQRHSPVVIAHLFSVLPKVGLSEDDVPEELLEELAVVTAQTGARIEVSERWSCPNARTLRPFLRRGVPLLFSTDSHRSDTIGRYSYCVAVLAELTDAESPVAG